MKRALTSLPSDLSPHLLQGVPLSICLSGCGQHWAAPSQYTDDFYATRRFCQRAENFDVFLSHDWKTSRWLKLCSLVMMFNVRAASILSMLVSFAVGLLRVYHVLPDERWTEIFPLIAFYLLLFFWQNIRELFLRPLVVFLDRLCISQTNDKLKEQGILGLAGFLDRSNILASGQHVQHGFLRLCFGFVDLAPDCFGVRLPTQAVLWSPRYFKSAWAVELLLP